MDDDDVCYCIDYELNENKINFDTHALDDVISLLPEMLILLKNIFSCISGVKKRERESTVYNQNNTNMKRRNSLFTDNL